MRVRGRAVLVACVMAIAACAHEKTRAEIEAEDAKAGTRSGTSRRTTPAPGALLSGPSDLQRLAALDDSARRFPTDPRAAGWLYAAGVEGAAHAFFDPATAADSGYLAALPDAYYLNEIAGSHTYTGWHLTQLVRRFPADTLADDAGFLLAEHHDFIAGECEGYFFCYLAASVGPWARFLGAHPASPLVPLALDAVDSALKADLEKLETGQAEFAAVDTMVRDPAQQGHQATSVDATFQEFEQAIRALPDLDRDRAQRFLEAHRARWLAVRDRSTAAPPSSP